MTKEQFWNKLKKEEFPYVSRLRLWWEKKMFNVWWSKKENQEFVEQIPFSHD